MLFNIKGEALNVGNTTMHYASFGKGKKTLVIIPGLSLNNVKGAEFPLAYMYRLFAKEYRVYVFDRKEIIPEGYTVKDIADDIAEAMKKLGLKSACIIGISQGGMAAQYLAADYPELVDKLVLGVTLSQNNETLENVVRNWIELCEKEDMQGFALDMLQKMYSEKYIRRYRLLLPMLAKMNKPKDMKRFINLAKACLTCNIYERLDEISCPVFVIGGSQDKIATGKSSEEIAEKLNCALYMYEELGHAAYEEAKDFNSRIYAFLQG